MDILNAVLAAKLAGDGGGEGSGDAKKEAAKALAEAKSYADSQDTTTLNSAKAYSDTKKTEANSYTDTKAIATLNSAKTYSDTNKTEANSYTNTKTAAALTTAKQYTDDEIETASQDIIQTAKNYTDDRIEELDVQFVAATGTIGTMTLGTDWSGTVPGPYTISVTISGYTITENTMVSVLPDATAITQMKSDQTEKIFVRNDNGSLTAYAIGGMPTAALTFPVLFTEVE